MTKRIGNQTPTQSVILPYTHSLGNEAVTLYEKSGRTAQAWQKNILSHILGKNGDDLWTHTKFGYSLPRQNGKNEVVVMRELWALLQGEQVLHTAHRTSTSHTAWERLVRLVEKIGLDCATLKAKGAERVQMIAGEGRVSGRTSEVDG